MAGQSVFFQKSKRAEKYASFHKKSRKAVKSECFKKSRRAGKSTSFKNQGGQKNPHPLKINKSGATWLLLIFSILIHDQKLRRAGKSSSFKKSRRAGNPASVHKKSKYGGAIRFSLKKSRTAGKSATFHEKINHGGQSALFKNQGGQGKIRILFTLYQIRLGNLFFP